MASIQNGNNESPPQLNNGIMAPIQNGYNDDPQQLDEYIMSSIQNGNNKSPPQLNDDVVRVVVIGEPRCGKTRFIRKYYDHHFPGDIYSHNGVRVYNCELEGFNQQRKASIFEIPGDPGFYLEQREPHYEKADIIVFMYAVDDPKSFQMLNEKWIPESEDIIELYKIPVVIVANKIDLQDDPIVIERLALENESPVTLEQGREMLDKFSGLVDIVECSANDLNLVESAFNSIMDFFLLTE